MIIVGIDPGVSGAVAGIDGALVVVGDIPVTRTKRSGRTRTEFNARLCAGLLRFEGNTHIFIEHVYPRPARGGKRDSLVSAHRMGVGIGLWLGIAGALRLPIEFVQPAVWKRKMGLLGADKEASRAKALQLFPQLADELKRKKDHNRAEALLIAEYARRHLVKGAT